MRKTIGFAVIAGLLLDVGCKKKEAQREEAKADPPAPVEKAKAALPPEKTPDELMDQAGNAKQAFDQAKPLMSDVSIDSTTNKGAILFSRWASTHLSWKDVFVDKDETTFGKIRKDSEEELGKRMCVSGMIVQIEVLKLDTGKKVAVGLLMSNGQNIYHFANAGSSGEIVQKKYARMCGFVMGNYSYANSGGGTSHGVDLVGMFDLPENKPKD
ncbi:MAG: hypothetical protein ACXWUG_10545 [Polyangiales bacterium]